MFTGLVEELGNVVALSAAGENGCARLSVLCDIAHETEIGDSISVNGCCLTVVANTDGRLEFDVVPESLDRTNLGQLSDGGEVNLERSLRVGDRMGGHFVTGHVDACGKVHAIESGDQWKLFWFTVPASLTRQMASKGCIAVDGISLTLVDVQDDRFSVAVIPHTLAVTTLGKRQVGDTVNIETDLIAKYLERGSQASELFADTSIES